MRKLSPTKAIAHAFNSVASYRHIALRIGAFWVPVLLVLAFLQSFVAPVNPEAPELGPGVFLEIASGIIGFLAFCSMAVSWHRFILRDELGSPSRIDRDVIRYAGNSLLIMLIGAVPLGLFAGILTVFLPPLSFLVLPAAIAAGAVIFRLSIKLPAVALGRTDFTFKDAWAASEGNTLPLIGVFLLNAAIAFAASSR